MTVILKAELRLLATTEGGRATPMTAGYRSLVRFGAEDAPTWGAGIDFDSPSALAPGEIVDVRFGTWAEESPEAPSGTQLFLYEGQRLVGVGVIR